MNKKNTTLLVAYNPYFSKKMTVFLEKKKLKIKKKGEQHFLTKGTSTIFQAGEISPFIIQVHAVKKITDEKKLFAYIKKYSKKNTQYGLRVWVNPTQKKTGRDYEVKWGKGLDKEGVSMHPKEKENIWYIVHTGKEFLVTEEPHPLDAHLFPYVDGNLTSEETITRSGKKLRFILEAAHTNVTDKIIADLGCGTGGWTHTLIEKGAQHVYAIDKTTLDKGLQKNKRITYIPKKTEEAPALPMAPEIVVCDINVNPEHSRKIVFQFLKKNKKAKIAIITQKILGGKDLNSIPKKGTMLQGWKVIQTLNTWWARREYYLVLQKQSVPKKKK